MNRPRPAAPVCFGLASLVALASCGGGAPVQETRVVPPPESLAAHCEEAIGAPRVEEVAPGVFVAIGFDVANTILVATPAGNVVIDAMMSPQRAAAAKAALLARAPGPTRALVFTHSHIDHVGGASVWIEEGTEVWATDAFMPRFLDQYGVFQRAEATRGARQFGRSIPVESLPCAAIGARPDFEAEVGRGARAPTRTFSGEASLEVGGVRFELVEAHGETDDQLFVWLPAQRVLMPGDNVYRAFPNLYTIRGTRRRPVERWVASLDAMRRRRPAALVPSHTAPVVGEAEIEGVLRDYRDAIAYLHAAVVRAANAGEDVEAMAARVGLPAHLAGSPWLRELYGQVDWSARAIYGGELGWFDGDADELYVHAPAEAARREVAMMGGAAAVRAAADAALASDPRWAAHLLRKLLDGGELDEAGRAEATRALAEALRGVAAGVANTNGRGYLLQRAFELEAGEPERIRPVVDDALLEAIPVEVFFAAMSTRLRLEGAAEVHEALAIELREGEGEAARRVWITVRRGVVEVAHGEALPGTPTPLAVVKTDAMTWKKLALQVESPAGAIAGGRLEIEGSALAVKGFLDRFERGV